MKVKTLILMLALALTIGTLSSIAFADDTNGTNGNGNLIVKNPEECPEGTTPVLLENHVDHAVGSSTTGDSNSEEIEEYYECIPVVEVVPPPEPPVTTEMPVATQEAAAAPEESPPVASLPATGMLLLIPAAGLAVTGIGFLVMRKRS
jgi:hypothetical protein